MPLNSVTTRITNPYMPNGTADQTNAVSPAYAPGEVGSVFNEFGRAYQRVWLDSGATSATPVGAVAANQLAFWKDKTNFIVTNDQRFATTYANGSAANDVAGIFRTAVTAAPGVVDKQSNPAQYLCDVLIFGQNIPVLMNGAGGAGQLVTADVTAATARAVPVAYGTAPGYMVLGQMRGATVSGVANIDAAIGAFD